MRSTSRRLGLLFCTILLTASPAMACRNDTSTARAEQEFRSSYETKQVDAGPMWGVNLWGVAAVLVGGALIGACLVAGRAAKSQDHP
jgi:hypothetical protein